jgi:hypothetical protein
VKSGMSYTPDSHSICQSRWSMGRPKNWTACLSYLANIARMFQQ